MLKNATLAVLSVAYSGMITAGTMGPICAPGNVSTPCASNQWELGIEALYLQPIYSASRSFEPAIGGGNKEISPKWGWGYQLEGSYFFNTGNDIQMSWLHYDVKSKLGLFSGQYLQLLPQGAILITAPYSNAITNRFDQVNLNMGQHTLLGLQQQTRFYAGMQYANIRVDGTQQFTNLNPLFLAATEGVRAINNTDFNGFGPSIGIDYTYMVINGLSLTANSMGSLLYGTSRLDNSTLYGNGLVVSNLYASQKRVVPSLEFKLGATYSHPMAQGLLSIEGGYQGVNYFDALQARSVSASTLLANSDFGLYGPYFGVRWLANA